MPEHFCSENFFLNHFHPKQSNKRCKRGLLRIKETENEIKEQDSSSQKMTIEISFGFLKIVVEENK